MKSLANTIELQKRTMGIYEVEKEKSTKELLDNIQEKIKYLEENQRYSLSEQEKIHIKTLNIEQLMNEMIINQSEMKNNIDILIERWG